MSPLALTLALALAPPAGAEAAEPGRPPPGPDAGALEAAERRPWELQLGLSGRAGASAGHLLTIPWAFALPGGGVAARLDYGFSDQLYARGTLSVNLGVGETGTLGGSYRGLVGIGYEWLGVGWATFDTVGYAGLQSLSLIPVPGLGGRMDLGFKPVRLDWLVWEMTFSTGLDFLVIVPRGWAAVSTGVYVPIGRWRVGVEGSGTAEAIVAVIANVVSATATAQVYATYRF